VQKRKIVGQIRLMGESVLVRKEKGKKEFVKKSSIVGKVGGGVFRGETRPGDGPRGGERNPKQLHGKSWKRIQKRRETKRQLAMKK